MEIFKIKMKLAPGMMNDIFDFIKCRYPLKNKMGFKSRNIGTVRYEIKTAAFVGSRIWTNMPNELKKSTSLNESKSKKKFGSQKTAHANSVKSTFRELVTFKLLISICSQMLLFMLFYSILIFFIQVPF